MALTRLNPPDFPRPDGFVHVVVATGGRQVFVAGQVSIDRAGQLVGPDDLAAQTEQALLNVDTALRAASATFDDIATATLYVVDWHESKVPELMAGAARASKHVGSAFLTTTTLVPVARLFEPGYLIEIAVTAVTSG